MSWISSLRRARDGADRRAPSPQRARRPRIPYWSKDGRALYFLSDRSGTSQLWKLPVAAVRRGDAGDEVRARHRGAQFLAGRVAAAARLHRERARRVRGQGRREGGRSPSLGDHAARIQGGRGRRLSHGRSSRAPVRLDLASGKLTSAHLRRVSASRMRRGRPTVARLSLSSNREDEPDASYKTDLWLVAPDNTDRGQSLVRLTNDERVKSAPGLEPGRTHCLPDGRGRGLRQPAARGDAGDRRRATNPDAPLDRWVNSFSYSADGEWIYFLFEDDGGDQLARVRPRDGRLEQVLSGDRMSRRSTSRRLRRGRRAHRERERRAGDLLRSTGRGARAADRRQRRVSMRVGRARRQGEVELQEPRRHAGRGVRDEAAGLRAGPPLSDDPAHPRRAGRPVRLRLSTSSRSTSRRTATSSSSRTRAAPPAAARTSSARSTRPGASPTTTT